ncbi:MAG: hypothetical protein AABZ06_12040 [Bdellovibrionota bacterium]
MNKKAIILLVFTLALPASAGIKEDPMGCAKVMSFDDVILIHIGGAAAGAIFNAMKKVKTDTRLPGIDHKKKGKEITCSINGCWLLIDSTGKTIPAENITIPIKPDKTARGKTSVLLQYPFNPHIMPSVEGPAAELLFNSLTRLSEKSFIEDGIRVVAKEGNDITCAWTFEQDYKAVTCSFYVLSNGAIMPTGTKE